MATAAKKRAPRAKPAPKPVAMKKTDSGATPLAFWAGDFGKEYTARNQVEWRNRIPFLRRMIELTNCGTFLDVGCNAGWNLRALREINKDFQMSGVDVNHDALLQAQEAGFDVVNVPASEIDSVDDFSPGCAEMVITSGVLIHIPPSDLLKVMEQIVQAASQYVLAIEYDSPDEREVEYRGHAGRLWKRPFGQIYAGLGLSIVETGVADGYVDATYWLMEKS